jgi:hypothetical protein
MKYAVNRFGRINFIGGGTGQGQLAYNDGANRLQLFVGDNVTEDMTILDGGNVGIGTTNPSQKLHVVGNVEVQGNIHATGTVTWDSPSSRRWKTNIQTLQGALEKVRRLRGVSFDWKESKKRDIGLIAEEVGEVVPEVVSYEANGKDAKGVSYDHLVGLLIEAVKEQQLQIEALTRRVADLEKAQASIPQSSNVATVAR